MKTLVGLTVREAIERLTHWDAETETDAYNRPHLDTIVRRVLIAPHGFDRALVTDALAWVIRGDVCIEVKPPFNKLGCGIHPSVLSVYKLKRWMRNEGNSWQEPSGVIADNIYNLTEERMNRRRA